MSVCMPIFVTRSIMIPTMIWLIMRCLMMNILAVGGSSGQSLYVCKNSSRVTSFVYLQFKTTVVSGIIGNCSCKFRSTSTSFINFETDAMVFPNCTNGDIAFTVMTHENIIFACDNSNGIKATPGQELSMVRQNTGDTVWLIMSRTLDSSLLSGSIAISSRRTGGSIGPSFLMSCYEPNVNIPSLPTTQETLTYSSSSTSTKSTASTASTTSPRITLDSSTSISTTSTSLSAATTKLPETSILTSSSKIHENSFSSTTSLIISTSYDKPTANSESLNGNPAAAIGGGIAGGIILVMVIIGCVVFHRRYRIIRRKDNNQIPESRDHPTYCDLSNRENTEYEHIDHDKGPNRNYQNVALDVSE